MKKTFLLLIVTLMAACTDKEPKEDGSAVAELSGKVVMLSAEQARTAGIRVSQPQEHEVSRVIRAYGVVEIPPQNLVSVSVPLGGFVKETRMLEGQSFRKGDVLAILEDMSYIELQQDYLVAAAKLENAEQVYKRQKELNENKASSDKVLQQAKADYETLKITVSALGQKLRLINVDPSRLDESSLSKSISLRAPFDGFVSEANVNTGSRVGPADVLFKLVDPNDVHLVIRVFEKDLPFLDKGQRLTASSNVNPGLKVMCEIIHVGRSISRERTAEVHCHFLEHLKTLVPGMQMTAEISTGTRKVPGVPEEAIVSYDGKEHVFVVKGDNVFEMTPVTSEFAGEGWCTIGDSTLKNAKIVTSGAYTLLMALRNKSSE